MASELRVDRIVPVDGVSSGGGGGIIQVQSATKTDAWNMPANNTSFHTVTGMSVTITPKFNTSKILVMYDMNWSAIGGHCSCRLMRDSTPIKVGNASGNKTQVTGQIHYTSGDQYDLENVSGTHLDSPSTTSAVTYSMQVGTPYSSSYEVYVNYHAEDGQNLAWQGRGASTITVMEVSA